MDNAAKKYTNRRCRQVFETHHRLVLPCTLCSGDQGARIDYNGDGQYWCQDCHFQVPHSSDVTHIAADCVYEQTSSDGLQWAVVVG